MLISQKQLKKVLVETQSGQLLGYVNDFELETDTGAIEKYHVRAKNLIPGLFEDSLIINKSQVINFDENKMVVEDMTIKAAGENKGKLAKVNNLESAESVVTSEEM